jgi:hypothetical protein
MNISVLDRITGMAGPVQANTWTAQGPASQASTSNQDVTDYSEVAAPTVPVPATEPPPHGYASWEDAYYTGFIK